MPTPDIPSATLGPELSSFLLRNLLWLLAIAAIVALTVVLVSVRASGTIEQLRGVLFGPVARVPEPGARRFLRTSFGLLWIVDGLLQMQSAMPTAFIAQVIEPQAAAGPSWVNGLVAPLARAWTRHPIAADAVTVWVQLGLGLLLLIGGRGLLAVFAAWASIVWSLVVWVFGEAFGGLVTSGASWWAGVPGAVLCYAVAAGLLLVSWSWWTSGRAVLLARRFVAGWLVLTAVLQAIPAEHDWTSAGASAPFADAAAHRQPAPLRAPIAQLESFAADAPAALNAVTIVVLLAVGSALWFTARPAVIYAAVALCAVTWWLGQDFGVLGGTGTDPNAALPLALLALLAAPVWRARGAEAPLTGARRSGVLGGRLRTGFGAAAVAAAAVAVVVLPAVLASGLPGSADAAAVRADSDGGLRKVPARPAPPFDLVDQNGAHVSITGLRGKTVVLTFLDAVCNTDCPLVANQLATADRRLGGSADRVEFVAIDTNPVFHFRGDVAAFTESHGLGRLPNWHFVSGDPDTVQTVLGAYGIAVAVPAVGMVEHTEALYFITPDGREAAYLDDGAAVELTRPYADEVLVELRSLLK